MGFKFNALTGELDLTGTSSGGSGTQEPNYFTTFNNSSDWGSASGGQYTLTILASTHGKGLNPIVQILEQSGSDFLSVVLTHKLNSSGDVILEVLETPDNRFAGKIIISENN